MRAVANAKFERIAYEQIKETKSRERRDLVLSRMRWLKRRVDAILVFTVVAIVWSVACPSRSASPLVLVPLIGLAGIGLKSVALPVLTPAGRRRRPDT